MEPTHSTTERRVKSSRYRRAEQPADLILQPRDVKMLMAVDDYRFLSRSQLQRLFFSGLHRACRRLRQLYDHQYVDRLWVPRTALGLPDPVDEPLAITGSPPALYRLGKAGVPIVARARDEDVEAVRQRVRERPKPTIMAHDYLLNELRVQTAIAVASRPDLTLELWLSGPECFERYEHHDRESGRDATRVFNPDAFFRLAVGGGVAAVFVEIDLGTESIQRRFKHKIWTYRTYVKSGQFLGKFGQKRFRIMVVTTSERRIQNLGQVAAEFKASEVFWFTTRDQLLATEDFLRASIWRRPPSAALEPFLSP